MASKAAMGGGAAQSGSSCGLMGDRMPSTIIKKLGGALWALSAIQYEAEGHNAMVIAE